MWKGTYDWKICSRSIITCALKWKMQLNVQSISKRVKDKCICIITARTIISSLLQMSKWTIVAQVKQVEMVVHTKRGVTKLHESEVDSWVPACIFYHGSVTSFAPALWSVLFGHRNLTNVGEHYWKAWQNMPRNVLHHSSVHAEIHVTLVTLVFCWVQGCLQCWEAL